MCVCVREREIERERERIEKALVVNFPLFLNGLSDIAMTLSRREIKLSTNDF